MSKSCTTGCTRTSIGWSVRNPTLRTSTDLAWPSCDPYASRAGKKPYIEDVEVKGDRPEEEVAAEAWGNYLLRDRSIVVDTFQGQLKSTVR